MNARLTKAEVNAMVRVVEYLFTDEREDYEGSQAEALESHIFNPLMVLKLAIERFEKEGRL